MQVISAMTGNLPERVTARKTQVAFIRKSFKMLNNDICITKIRQAVLAKVQLSCKKTRKYRFLDVSIKSGEQ